MNNITYTRCRDYLLADLIQRESPRELTEPITKHGAIRQSFLREHRRIIYNRLLLSEQLFPHLRKVQRETLITHEYLVYYFPFHTPDLYKDKDTAQWNVSSKTDSREVLALAMTFASEPFAVGMSLLPIYGERFDWLVTQFRDWAYMFVSMFLYYEDKYKLDESTRDLYRQGVSAFGGKALTYRIRLYDEQPKIVWDFHSLLMTIQTVFGLHADRLNPPHAYM